MTSRRNFVAASFCSLSAAAAEPSSAPLRPGDVSLNGAWEFRLDPDKNWTRVTVPHTWQTAPQWSGYMGVAWYRRSVDAPAEWASGAVRVEFEAVFHSATVWVNGELAGEHLGKGYTAFTFDITRLLRAGASNLITVRVDNASNESMLPRGRSSDWTHDGGIYRPVSLLVTPKVFIERVDVEAVPDLANNRAALDVAVVVRNTSAQAWRGKVNYRVAGEATRQSTNVDLPPSSVQTIRLPAATLPDPKLWHFDHPHLYRLAVELGPHTFETTFGVRTFEVTDGTFSLNGEPVRLAGVERMAGSHPEYGMAEPLEWLTHDHDDLKELNCVFTRVHWQQDRRVLDYCDRHGILIQVEVPAWGGGTFRGMKDEPSPEIMENGLEQLHEMIQRDRNHPCIFAWGLANEINGQNPPAYQFVKRMYEEARKLDPRRLRSYASNSLRKMPERDVAGLMDFIEWNEYYESWTPGTAEDMRRNLEAIHRAFPGKAIVISEYGYCACTPQRPEADAARIRILREHNRVFRDSGLVAGLIFFCYNDYRTHVGDKGLGVMKQRVHGVVDLYGARKPSFAELRGEASPIESLDVKGEGGSLSVVIETRKTIPAYTLTGYKLRSVVYGRGNIPLERYEAPLPRLEPGQQVAVTVRFQETSPVRVDLDVLRPTGCPASRTVWRP